MSARVETCPYGHPVAWWTTPENVAALLRWLRDSDAGLELADAIAIVEKPHHWTTEYETMRAEEPREKRSAASMAAELMGDERASR